MIAVGIWLLVRNQDFDFLTNSIYLSPAVLLIVAGVITVVISVVGIVGAVGMWWCVIVVVSRAFFYSGPRALRGGIFTTLDPKCPPWDLKKIHCRVDTALLTFIKVSFPCPLSRRSG